MKHQDSMGADKGQASPYSSSSLIPMLVLGLVLTLAGMVAAVLLT
jgi:hypothetical protein